VTRDEWVGYQDSGDTFHRKNFSFLFSQRIKFYTGCNRNTRNNFNHELLASCRTLKKYLKNSGVRFIKHDIQGCILKMC
jgi:hypothetical protein